MLRKSLLIGLFLLGATPGTSQESRDVPPTDQHAVKVRFELAPKGETAPQRLQGALVLQPVAVRGEPISVPVDGGSPVEVALPNRSRWTLNALFPGYWSPQKEIAAEAWRAERPEQVILWPIATLKGVLKLPPEAKAEGFAVRIEEAPFSRTSLPRADIPCSLDEKLAFSCEVPAGNVDLSFRAKSFIPAYRWGVALKPGEQKPLGEVIFKEGSSVSGWVTVEEGRVAPGCRAKLLTATAGRATAPSLSHRVAKAGNEAPVNRDGFFQLTGVAPGSYVLVVEQPGFAPAELPGVDVWPGSETGLMDPLLLQRPLELEIALAPPMDWLQRPWHVEILRAHDFSAQMDRKPVFDGLASEEGVVHVKGQRPGRYSVLVSDSLGNRLASDPVFEVSSRDEARREIRIELVSVRGEVTYGKDPIATTLWFGGRFGGQRVEMASDAEGTFHGVLPRGGRWRVAVSAAEPRLETRVAVEVEPNKDGEAEVDIQLPDTRVFGRVLTEQGAPLPGAEVSFESIAGSVEAESRAEGRFEMRALPQGRLLVSARAHAEKGRLLSEVVGFDLTEGRAVGPLDLVVRPTKPLVGRVESVRGPVVGGSVLVYSQDPPLGASAVARTGLDGAFTVAVPGYARRLTAVVSPPGRALKAFSLPAMEEPVVLHVPEEGGGLELDLPMEADQAGEQELAIVIHQDDLRLPQGDLLRWAMGHGVSMYEGRIVRIPQLAPGKYEACLTPVAVPGPNPESWKTSKTVCAEGYLFPGNTLRLKLAKSGAADPTR